MCFYMFVVCLFSGRSTCTVKQAYEHWKDVHTCDNETLVENPSHPFNLGSPSLHENQYNQLPTQVSTDGFSLSNSAILSPNIFSMEPSSALDPCSILETEESSANQFQSVLPPVGGHEVPREPQKLDKMEMRCVWEEDREGWEMGNRWRALRP